MNWISFKRRLPKLVPHLSVFLLMFFFALPAHAHAAGFDDIFGSVLDWGKNTGVGIASALIDGIAYLILQLANYILGIAGALFNLVVTKTVLEYANVFGNSAGLLTAWGILRDIGNIILLFGFLFIGIATILDLGNYTAKKALIGLLIFATALNFSLFAAEGVVDISNALSSVMYSQAGVDNNCPGTDVNHCAATVGIAGHIMQSTGLSGIFSFAPGTSQTNGAVVMICLAIFSIVGSVVLFAASIMLIIRAVTLTLLIVASPIGFAGMAVPPLKKFASQWWNTLISQAFFAPILLLMIFISLKITDSLASGGGLANTSLGVALTQLHTDTMGIVLVFMLVIGFLIGSLMAAQKFGAMGAGFATGAASGIVFGSLTRASNLAVGGSAYGLRRLQQSTGFGGRTGEVFVNRALRPLQGANLDLRRIGGGALMRAAGASSNTGPASHASFSDMQHQFHDIKDRKRSKELQAQYDQEVAKQNLENQAHHDDTQPAGTPPTFSNESQQALLSMTTKELEELHGIKNASATLARNLTPDQFGKLMEGDGLDKRQKQNLANARFSTVNAPLVPAGSPAGTLPTPAAIAAKQSAVRALSVKDLEQLAKYNPAGYSEILSYGDPATGEGFLSGPQHDKLVDSTVLTNAQRGETRTNSKRGRIEAAAGLGTPAGNATAQAFTATMNSKDKAKLSADALASDGVIAALTMSDLGDIQREGKLQPHQIRAIRHGMTDPSHPQSGAFQAMLLGGTNASLYWNA